MGDDSARRVAARLRESESAARYTRGMPRASKGERRQIPLRIPAEQFEVYRQAAADGGYSSINDYLVAQLAAVHQLPEPAWTRPADHTRQMELPLGA